MKEVMIDGVVFVPKQEPIAVNVTFVDAALVGVARKDWPQ